MPWHLATTGGLHHSREHSLLTEAVKTAVGRVLMHRATMSQAGDAKLVLTVSLANAFAESDRFEAAHFMSGQHVLCNPKALPALRSKQVTKSTNLLL